MRNQSTNLINLSIQLPNSNSLAPIPEPDGPMREVETNIIMSLRIWEFFQDPRSSCSSGWGGRAEEAVLLIIAHTISMGLDRQWDSLILPLSYPWQSCCENEPVLNRTLYPTRGQDSSRDLVKSLNLHSTNCRFGPHCWQGVFLLWAFSKPLTPNC